MCNAVIRCLTVGSETVCCLQLAPGEGTTCANPLSLRRPSTGAPLSSAEAGVAAEDEPERQSRNCPSLGAIRLRNRVSVKVAGTSIRYRMGLDPDTLDQKRQ